MDKALLSVEDVTVDLPTPRGNLRAVDRVNLALGPACACQLRTAVQLEDLPSMVRLRRARKILDRLRPLITAAQGEIRPNSVVGQIPILSSSDRTLDRWFNTAAFTRATVTYGTAPRNPLVGPGTKTADLSVSKTFVLHERHRVEFRWEAFNSLNTPQFSNPGGTLGSKTPSDSARSTNRSIT